MIQFKDTHTNTNKMGKKNQVRNYSQKYFTSSVQLA